MSDPKEFNSIDELFRKTFEDLPSTPAASGWDTPAPRVWEEVQVRLKPPHGGWSTQAILLVGSLAVALMLGLYWAVVRQEKADTTGLPSSGTALNTPFHPNQNAESHAVAPIASVQPETRPVPANTERPKRALMPAPTPVLPVEPRESPTAHSEEETPHHRVGGSAPLPGTKPALPNTTVRRRAEQWRSAPWAQPLKPLPTVLEKPFIRPVQ